LFSIVDTAMRLWRIHPSYLDTKGLLAVWREGLLALHVLSGQTKGYIHHPQLLRFRSQTDPIGTISTYLHEIADEADRRKYMFGRNKLPVRKKIICIPVTSGQMIFETEHLKKKLLLRDEKKYMYHINEVCFLPHPLFSIVEGSIESWEKRTK
jgi:hypothetical protein